jgi:hypothetical protein
MDTDINRLDKTLNDIYAQLSDAAKRHDLRKVGQLAVRAAQIEDLKRQFALMEQRITALCSADDPGTSPPSTNSESGLRQLPTVVTAGMIRQNLLTLSPHVKRGKIKPGEQLIIEALPSGGKFQTELLAQGNRLRARGEIAQFYRDANVKDGDHVLLMEVTPGNWTLSKAPEGYGTPGFQMGN